MGFPMSFVHLSLTIRTIAIFVLIAVGAIFIDIFMHRKDKPISLKSATMWLLFWIMIAMTFFSFLCIYHGIKTASLFLASYVLEEVLSIDNLFVMMTIFVWFEVPDKYRHRVFYWGVIGAILFRVIFVTIGTILLSLGPYIEVFFAFIISWSAVVMLQRKNENNEIKDYSNHLAYRVVKCFYPIWPKVSGNKFILTQKEVDSEIEKLENKEEMKIWRMEKAKRYATPLLLCMMVIELSDVMFAFDSVPAITAISQDPLIICSATLFAIFSLRTLYFVLEALKQYLICLRKAVILLLFFVAFKLFLNATDHFWHHGYNVSVTTSLIVMFSVLAIGIIASIALSKKKGV